MTSENDLFFHYTINLDADSFADLQSSQKLTIDFSDLPQIISKMLV